MGGSTGECPTGRGPRSGRAPALGDVVGDLAGLDAQTAVVDTRNGLVEVPVAYVTAARLVPPSTADELALEAVAARGWRPRDTELSRLAAARRRRPHPPRQLGAAAAPAELPLAEAAGPASAWYRERGLPLLIRSRSRRGGCSTPSWANAAGRPGPRRTC